MVGPFSWHWALPLSHAVLPRWCSLPSEHQAFQDRRGPENPGSTGSHGCVVTVAIVWPSLPSFLFCSLCIFCGERNESFTEEGLDLHYWKHCLMLTRCDHCRQVRSWAWAMAAHSNCSAKSSAKHKGTVSTPRFREKDQSTAAQILETPKEKSGEQRSLCYGPE